MKSYRLLYIILFYSSYCLGQNTDMFDKIQQIGKAYTMSLKHGDIESMKNTEPPKNTWTFGRLLEYKEVLSKKNTIKYGSFIQPSVKEDVYSFNLFALDYRDEERPYYFVAIVSLTIENNEPKVSNAYLFTEKKPLTDWWMATVSFYKSREEGKLKKPIPEKYIFPTCPPPPYNYLVE